MRLLYKNLPGHEKNTIFDLKKSNFLNNRNESTSEICQFFFLSNK